MTGDTFFVRRVVRGVMGLVLTITHIAVASVHTARAEYEREFTGCPGHAGHVFKESRIVWDGTPMDGYECTNCGDKRPVLYAWESPRNR